MRVRGHASLPPTWAATPDHHAHMQHRRTLLCSPGCGRRLWVCPCFASAPQPNMRPHTPPRLLFDPPNFDTRGIVMTPRACTNATRHKQGKALLYRVIACPQGGDSGKKDESMRASTHLLYPSPGPYDAHTHTPTHTHAAKLPSVSLCTHTHTHTRAHMHPLLPPSSVPGWLMGPKEASLLQLLDKPKFNFPNKIPCVSSIAWLYSYSLVGRKELVIYLHTVSPYTFGLHNCQVSKNRAR